MAIEIIAQIADADGDQASTSVRLADSATIAQANGFAVGWSQAVDAVIAGVIRTVLAFLRVDISALTGNLVGALSDVEHIGKFSFRTEDGIRTLVNVPCLAEITLGTTTSDVLDPVQVNVAAFITAMEDGINAGGALIEPCDIGEGDIVEVVFSREAFRNSGAKR
jgi:hypothetical protein